MHLSRIELPWDAVRNPYDIHRHLWRLFPGQEREMHDIGDTSRQGFLFRIEAQATGRPARLLLQSRRTPSRAPGIVILGSREFQPAPREGQQLAFILTANPIKTIIDAQRDAKPAKRSDKCRVPLIKEKEQLDWLARKVAKAATLESVKVLPHSPLYFRKGKRLGKLVTCTFEGILRITGPANLVDLLENGIGPAKAFGCGLLLVRRT